MTFFPWYSFHFTKKRGNKHFWAVGHSKIECCGTIDANPDASLVEDKEENDNAEQSLPSALISGTTSTVRGKVVQVYRFKFRYPNM